MNGGNVKPVCARGSQIIYAWAKNAEPLQLPEGEWGIWAGVLKQFLQYIVVLFLHNFRNTVYRVDV